MIILLNCSKVLNLNLDWNNYYIITVGFSGKYHKPTYYFRKCVSSTICTVSWKTLESYLLYNSCIHIDVCIGVDIHMFICTLYFRNATFVCPYTFTVQNLLFLPHFYLWSIQVKPWILLYSVEIAWLKVNYK